MDHKQFAVAAVLEIARHERDAKPGARPLSVSGLSAQFGLNPRGLETQFQILRGAGILVGVRGPAGGYRLGKSPRLITINDVVQALGGPGEADLDTFEEVTNRPEVALVRAEFGQAQIAQIRHLKSITIANLLAGIPAQKVAA